MKYYSSLIIVHAYFSIVVMIAVMWWRLKSYFALKGVERIQVDKVYI